MTKVLVIDNVDSFTFTLVDYLRQLGAAVSVVRASDISVADALAYGGPILISPGPGRPEDAGISVPLAAACMEQRHPLLGVCLGHQAIALAAGATIVRAAPVHGKTDLVSHNGSSLFAGLPTPLTVTRYHSLVACDLPAALAATAWSQSDGTIQAVQHRSSPVQGIQFHPESIASEGGLRLLKTFLADAEA